MSDKRDEQDDLEMFKNLDLLMDLDLLVEKEDPEFFENMDQAESEEAE